MTKEDLIEAFDQYSELIYKYLFVRVNNRKEVAEDLAQETFAKAWHNKDKFDPEKAALKTWLFVIARNLLKDFYKKKKNDPIEEGQKTEVSDHTKKVEVQIQFEMIVQKMNSLNSKDQELLTLRYIDELELDEIAEVIGSNYNATKVAVFRALNKLKEIINEPRGNRKNT